MAGTINPIVRVAYNGAIYAGARVHIYQSGTTTPITTYTDGAMTSANANPAITNSNGEITVYAPTTNALRFLIKTSDDVTTIADIDPVYPTPILTGLTAGVSALNLLDSTQATAIYNSAGVLVLKSSVGVELSSNEPILDSNGANLLSFTSNTSAVNRVNIANAATAVAPVISAKGTDTNIGITLQGKGTGVTTVGQSSAPTTINGNTINVSGTNATVQGSASTQVGLFTLPAADGSNGQAITTNGSKTLGFASMPYTAGFASVASFSSSGTWNVPAGITKCFIELWGAGGGGGGAGTTNSASGGGGAGAYLNKLLTIPNGTTSLSITIGTGGSGGLSSGGNGGNGSGASTVTGTGITTLSAGVGNGGIGCAGGSGGFAGGSGGTATGGDINISGQAGGASVNLNAGGTGIGGSSPRGGAGGSVSQYNTTGNPGNSPGGGGAGTVAGGSSQAGGAGANGFCIIYY